MKERWFNYRPICLVFIFLLLGTIFSFYLFSATIFAVPICLSVFIGLLVLAIYKKKPQYFILPLIAFCIGICSYSLSVYQFNKSIDYIPTTIEARIYNISNEANGMIAVECDSVTFNNAKQDTNILLYIYDNSGLFENIEVGRIIHFKPYNFYKSDLFYYGIPNASLFNRNIKYTVSVVYTDLNFLEIDKKFSEVVKETVHDNLHLGLTNENAEIAYSALFGDKDALSTTQYNVYKLSGVAHLLATSGLHVGIIYGILVAILTKCKVKKWYKFAIIVVCLLGYASLCGFSVSIIRASIMCIVLMLSKILGKEYDSLTSICLAGIVVFLVNPLCVFDVGFLLSFGCVTGIALLSGPMEKMLFKIKTPSKIAKGLAISISTTVTITFIMAYFFNTLNIISIVANLVVIPIFTLAFVPIFVLSVISLVFPYIAYILQPINYVLSFINLLCSMFGGFALSNLNTISFNFIAIIVYFLLLLILSRFCTAKYQYKLITAFSMVALLFCCLL